MTYVEMYLNIYDTFGKDSKEIQQYKKFFELYKSNHKIMEKIYKVIIKNKN